MCPSDFKRSRFRLILLCGLVTICRAAWRRIAPACCTCSTPRPLTCSVPIVVSVHDVSFLEHPQYFTFFRATAIAFDRSPYRKVRFLRPDAQRVFQTADSGCLQTFRRQGCGVAQRRQLRVSPRSSRSGAAQHAVGSVGQRLRPFHLDRGRPSAAQEPPGADPRLRGFDRAPIRSCRITC